jgi:hypothetical protein
MGLPDCVVAACGRYPCADPGEVARMFERLNVSPSSTFREFYLRFESAFGGRSGYVLLSIDRLERDTEVCREVHGFPTDCLIISELSADAALVYRCGTDAVYEVDFEGSDRELVAGTLEPRWPSFRNFLEDHFADGDES